MRTFIRKIELLFDAHNQLTPLCPKIELMFPLKRCRTIYRSPDLSIGFSAQVWGLPYWKKSSSARDSGVFLSDSKAVSCVARAGWQVAATIHWSGLSACMCNARNFFCFEQKSTGGRQLFNMAAPLLRLKNLLIVRIILTQFSGPVIFKTKMNFCFICSKVRG